MSSDMVGGGGSHFMVGTLSVTVTKAMSPKTSIPKHAEYSWRCVDSTPCSISWIDLDNYKLRGALPRSCT